MSPPRLSRTFQCMNTLLCLHCLRWSCQSSGVPIVSFLPQPVTLFHFRKLSPILKSLHLDELAQPASIQPSPRQYKLPSKIYLAPWEESSPSFLGCFLITRICDYEITHFPSLDDFSIPCSLVYIGMCLSSATHLSQPTHPFFCKLTCTFHHLTTFTT
jgi:hypothetical protein